MKQLLAIILTIFWFSENIQAQIPSWNWAWLLGGEEVDQIDQMEVDSAGNVYVMGVFKSSSVVIGSTGYTASTNAPRSFFLKFSPQGQLLWQKVYPANVQYTAFSLGKHQEIYLFGLFYGIFYIGPYALNSGTAVTRNFVAQLDSNSAVVWVNDEILNTNGTFFEYYAPHPTDGLLMIGASSYADTLGSIPIPEKSKYLVHMSRAGEIMKVVQLGGWGVTNDTLSEYNSSITFRDITVTPQGAVYIGGETRKYPQINTQVWQLPPLNYENQYDYMSEVFVAKFDSSLQFEWARVSNASIYPGNGYGSLRMGGLHAMPDESLVMGCSGGSYPLYFDSLEIGPSIIDLAYDNGFAVKYSPNGEVKWGKRFSPTDGLSQVNALCGDGLGNTYVCLYGGEFAFPDQPNIQNFVVSKIDSLGNTIWNKGSDNGPGSITFFTTQIKEDGRGNVFVAGGYANKFGPSPVFGSTTLPWFGDVFSFEYAYDAFLVKLNNCNSLPVDIVSNESPTFCQGDSVMVNVSGGPNFYWSDGDTSQTRFLHESGSYTVLSYNDLGCYGLKDTIEVVKRAPISSSQNFQLCAGDSIQVGSQTFNQSGIYQTVFSASNGCDSLVTTNLSVDTLSAEISLNALVLNALNVPAGAFIQWINCSTGTEIIGENGTEFIINEIGSYAYYITQNGCSDTSECISFSTVGLIDDLNKSNLISPNPANEVLRVVLSDKNDLIKLYSAEGKKVWESAERLSEYTIHVSQFPDGIYFLQTSNGSQKIIIHHE